jgi:hypothetical protein
MYNHMVVKMLLNTVSHLMGCTSKDTAQWLKMACVTVQIPAALLSYIFSSFLPVSDGLKCDTESDHYCLPTCSLKLAGSITHGEALFIIHDITKPKQLYTEQHVFLKSCWPCCIKHDGHAALFAMPQRSILKLPGRLNQYLACYHKQWYWRF